MPHIQLSFEDKVKGYRCFNFQTNIVLVSKDVCFLETYNIEVPDIATSFPITIVGPPLDPLFPEQPDIPTREPTPMAPTMLLPDTVPFNPTYNPPAFGPTDIIEELSETNQADSSILTYQRRPHASEPPAPRHLTRTHQPPLYHKDYLNIDFIELFVGTIEEGGENFTYDRARIDPKWQAAMASKYASIIKKQYVGVGRILQPYSTHHSLLDLQNQTKD